MIGIYNCDHGFIIINSLSQRIKAPITKTQLTRPQTELCLLNYLINRQLCAK